MTRSSVTFSFSRFFAGYSPSGDCRNPDDYRKIAKIPVQMLKSVASMLPASESLLSPLAPPNFKKKGGGGRGLWGSCPLWTATGVCAYDHRRKTVQQFRSFTIARWRGHAVPQVQAPSRRVWGTCLLTARGTDQRVTAPSLLNCALTATVHCICKHHLRKGTDNG